MLSNLITARGNVSPQQRTLAIGGFHIFQSYDSIIFVRFPDGSSYLGEDYAYSKTTSKYLKQYLARNNFNMPTDIKSNRALNSMILEFIDRLK